ncbi:MAG: TVP38/TMEM64 family protein, partial [Verrucomicrobia bacterium]|nr:TVP38/TMEM64 family protein [Verrucomicrobiota bacterium]
NLAPAVFNVKLRTFVWTTFVGILPGAYVFTQAGEGLGAIFQSQGGLSLDAIFNIKVKIALIALGIFALIPIVVKKIRGKNA